MTETTVLKTLITHNKIVSNKVLLHFSDYCINLEHLCSQH